MNRDRARATLILACVRDHQDTCTMDDEYLRNILEHGHVGFASRSNGELLSICYERGLQEQDDELNEACETLEEPVP